MTLKLIVLMIIRTALPKGEEQCSQRS